MRAALFLSACLCACSLGGKQPTYDYYVLTPTRPLAEEADRPSEVARRPSVVIAQVTIPGYLDRDAIATRQADNHISYSSRERWAEPLDTAIESTLRQELAAELTPEGFNVPAQSGAPTYDVHVDILRFERSGPQTVELWARWTLRSEAKQVHTAETRLRLPVESAAEGAAAASLSRALAQLATAIAQQVEAAEPELSAARTRRANESRSPRSDR
ncbi:MAG: PqiC family protein [Kofleriaceae bacterium]|nr:PqiC family protein [Kofleriaceae bacterium]